MRDQDLQPSKPLVGLSLFRILATLGIVGFLIMPMLPALLHARVDHVAGIQNQFSGLSNIFRYGYLGAFALLMVTGYLAAATAHTRNIRYFVTSRLSRLLPILLISVIVSIALITKVRPPGISFSDSILNLLGLPTVPWATSLDTSGIKPLNATMWSIGKIAHFYIIICVIMAIKAFKNKWLAASTLWTLLAVFELRLEKNSIIYWIIGAETAPFFIIGIMLYLIAAQGCSWVKFLILGTNALLALQFQAVISAPWVKHADSKYAAFGLLALVGLLWLSTRIKSLPEPVSRTITIVASLVPVLVLTVDPIAPAVLAVTAKLGLPPWLALLCAVTGAAVSAGLLYFFAAKPLTIWLHKHFGTTTEKTGNVEKNGLNSLAPVPSSLNTSDAANVTGQTQSRREQSFTTSTQANKIPPIGIPEPRGRRLYALDGIRLVAALAVMLSHIVGINDSRGLDIPALNEVTSYGFLGVHLFFLISGYVILMSSWNSTIPKFIASRIARLYPAYWVAVILGIPLLWAYYKPVNFFVKDYLATLTMVHRTTLVPEINTAFWTLSIELRFYLLIIALMVLGLTLRKTIWFTALWPIASAVLVPLDNPLLNTILIPQYSGLFSSGMVLYLIHKDKLRVQYLLILLINYIWATRCLRQSSIWCFENNPHFPKSMTLLLLGLTLCYALVWLCTSRIGSKLNFKWAQTAGALSYPLYVIHLPLWAGVNLLYPTAHEHPYFTLISTVCVALVISWIIYRFVEKPTGPRLRRTIISELSQDQTAQGNNTSLPAAANIDLTSAANPTQQPITPTR